jgi:hypothetical protein
MVYGGAQDTRKGGGKATQVVTQAAAAQDHTTITVWGRAGAQAGHFSARVAPLKLTKYSTSSFS